MNIPATKHYAIHLFLPEDAPSALWSLQQHDELFLSSYIRLCGLDKYARLESCELAEEFREACLNRIRKRYGTEVDIKVVEMTTFRMSPYLAKRIAEDSALVKARIKFGIMASNQKPPGF